MADGDGDDELAMEMEALSYTYPEIEIEVFEPSNSACTEAGPAAAAAVRIDLRPRAARQAFVAAALRLTAPRGYPAASPPIIELREPRGLGDAREAALLARLAAEARDLIGSPCLGQLIELCQDLLSDANAPEGPCAICLSVMEPGPDDPEESSNRDGCTVAAPPALARLPCYHTFHTPCFERWWAFEQASCAAQQRELAARTGATAAAALAQAARPNPPS
ncbi:hypothetical protein MNEG_15987 [Monoraphidium neglectum]|uniref:RWD domain-containing protein n=1 Tax=Monoraphidium neglectum TaxID=145388 RepID=A0A0D2LPS3_9CHLO|nr:hypothetical protein MNEG_15987 [Monoraphidium neglectum]KIY91976.1 hypothetical protein MNEG_15987 [Monoraphidium neglectum]|eukprot:XP_013890996.1 hypothetical protein MNEG_15987 [Monoraphidium neglectum]